MSKSDDYLRKVAHNKNFTEDLSQSMWERIHNYQPKRSFQPGELTTGQVAEIYHTTSSTVGKACHEGFIPGAWRDEVRHWWHIPESSLDQINADIFAEGFDWTANTWIRHRAKVKKIGKYGEY